METSAMSLLENSLYSSRIKGPDLMVPSTLVILIKSDEASSLRAESGNGEQLQVRPTELTSPLPKVERG